MPNCARHIQRDEVVARGVLRNRGELDDMCMRADDMPCFLQHNPFDAVGGFRISFHWEVERQELVVLAKERYGRPRLSNLKDTPDRGLLVRQASEHLGGK
ncbi:hypothetical protein D3C78_1177820 [compost metagenome]